MRKGNFKILESFEHFSPGWKGVLKLFLWMMVGAVIGNVLTFVLGLFLGTEWVSSYGTVIAYPIMFIPPMFYARRRSMMREHLEANPLNKGVFKPYGAPLCALLAVGLTIAAGYIADPVVTLLPDMPEFLEQALESMVSGNVLINLLCVSVFAPFFEEWLCRGMVLRGLLARNVKPVWAILFSAFFFAFIHFNPWQAIPAFMLGCLFGYVYYKTRSLSLTMLMHCVNNTLAVVLGQIDSLKDMKSWMDVLEPQLFWIIFAACVLFLVLGVRAISRIHVVDSEDVSTTA